MVWHLSIKGSNAAICHPVPGIAGVRRPSRSSADHLSSPLFRGLGRRDPVRQELGKCTCEFSGANHERASTAGRSWLGCARTRWARSHAGHAGEAGGANPAFVVGVKASIITSFRARIQASPDASLDSFTDSPLEKPRRSHTDPHPFLETVRCFCVGRFPVWRGLLAFHAREKSLM